MSSSQSQDSLTAVDYLSSQMLLEKEAKELMPYDPNSCTYAQGPLRQQVYACLTCYEHTNIMNGVCYSCSIQCHASHNLVELFTKRQFTCDCGTKRCDFECNLRSKVKDDIPSSTNIYNHNFKGQFCDCSRDYDPNIETGNMLQCILGDVCTEDWFHDYCIMGLPKFKPEVKSNDQLDGVNLLDTLKEPEVGEDLKGNDNELNDASTNNANNNDDEENDEDEVAIDGFPRLDDFDCFVCWKCVSNNKQFFDLIKNNKDIVNDFLLKVDSESIQERNEKIIKNETENSYSVLNTFKRTKITKEYEYSIFLNENHEENFKNFIKLNEENITKKEIFEPFFKKFPFLLNDDPIYEPQPEEEEDDDDNSSIFDLGSKALNSLPRAQAIEGVQAYEDVKDKLKSFLLPFAKDGKIVNKEDIDTFFKALKKK